MRCLPGPGAKLDARVVLNRHAAECGTPEECPGCLPCPEDHCQVCRREHAARTCPSCLGRARGRLDLIVYLTGQLHREAVMGSRGLHADMPGGDALVLLAPGHYWPVLEPGPETQANDPRPPLAVLTYWHDLWRNWSDAPTGLPATMSRVRDYLAAQLHRIAETEAFPLLARDLARTVRQLEDVLYEGDRPEVSKVPCLRCGVRLVKVYADQAARDHWACPRCRDRYDPGRYERAKHHHLASTGADRYVPVIDAIDATGRPEQTVRAWIRRDLVQTRRHPRTRRLEVWWPDVRELHLATPTRRRKAG